MFSKETLGIDTCHTLPIQTLLWYSFYGNGTPKWQYLSQGVLLVSVWWLLCLSWSFIESGRITQLFLGDYKVQDACITNWLEFMKCWHLTGRKHLKKKMQLCLWWETQDPVFFFFFFLTIQESKSISASAASILAIPFYTCLFWVPNFIVCNTLSDFKIKPSQVWRNVFGALCFYLIVDNVKRQEKWGDWLKWWRERKKK